MAKSYKRQSRRQRKSRRHSRRHMRGGYSSAASYGEYVNGSVDSQIGRVFDIAGPYGNIPGNVSIGAQGQNAIQPNMPSTAQLALVQSAGKRRGKGRGRKGGFLSQAIVPFALLGMQHKYATRKNKSRGKGKGGALLLV